MKEKIKEAAILFGIALIFLIIGKLLFANQPLLSLLTVLIGPAVYHIYMKNQKGKHGEEDLSPSFSTHSGINGQTIINSSNTDYIYKSIPVPSTIDTGKAGKANHEQAVLQYENLINASADGGWELVDIDSVGSYQKAGCLSSIFGKKDEVFSFKLLVFRKENM